MKAFTLLCSSLNNEQYSVSALSPLGMAHTKITCCIYKTHTRTFHRFPKLCKCTNEPCHSFRVTIASLCTIELKSNYNAIMLKGQTAISLSYKFYLS